MRQRVIIVFKNILRGEPRFLLFFAAPFPMREIDSGGSAMRSFIVFPVVVDPSPARQLAGLPSPIFIAVPIGCRRRGIKRIRSVSLIKTLSGEFDLAVRIEPFLPGE